MNDVTSLGGPLAQHPIGALLPRPVEAYEQTIGGALGSTSQTRERPKEMPPFRRVGLSSAWSQATRREEPAPKPTLHDPLHLVALVKTLLGNEQIAAARKLVDLIPAGSHEELGRLRMVLQLPTTRRRTVAYRTRASEVRWLQRNAAEYKGKWVAVLGDQLIAANESLASVRAAVRESRLQAAPLLYRIP